MSGASGIDLHTRTALVIGASRGLGREAALAVARCGADVVCAARTTSAVEQVAEEITALGRRALALTVDAADEHALTACVNDAAAFAPIDVLVYAAGLQHAGAALKTATVDWERLLKVNLTGGFIAARSAAQHMKIRGGRMIFFSTSFVGSVLPMTVAYGASKGGLQQMVHTLALEWARYNITVNAIAPGYFETDMPKAVLDDPDLRSRVLARIPLRRFGQPAEIGPLVAYLASDASAFMTGAVLRIDGGQALNVS
ncbi:MAG: SDR family oxidoreductase [Acidobacteria bacterium]|nr:SDR family oxidoreductase [Acidobacteriota bacterium]